MQRCPPRSADRCPRAAHRASLASPAPLKNRDPELACASHRDHVCAPLLPAAPGLQIPSQRRRRQPQARYRSVNMCMKSARPRSRSSLVSGTPSCPNRLLPREYATPEYATPTVHIACVGLTALTLPRRSRGQIDGCSSGPIAAWPSAYSTAIGGPRPPPGPSPRSSLARGERARRPPPAAPSQAPQWPLRP
jgi:hypothetical protein